MYGSKQGDPASSGHYQMDTSLRMSPAVTEVAPRHKRSWVPVAAFTVSMLLVGAIVVHSVGTQRQRSLPGEDTSRFISLAVHKEKEGTTEKGGKGEEEHIEVCKGWCEANQADCRLKGLDRIVKSFQDENCKAALKSPENARLVGEKITKLVTNSSFVFFRGAAAFFYYEMMCDDPHFVAKKGNKHPHVISNGDTHPENFGTMELANGKLVWGTNDFDQSFSAPFTWDVKRGATGIIMACKSRGWKDCGRFAKDWVDGYRSVFNGKCKFTNDDLFVEESAYLTKKEAEVVAKVVTKIREKRGSPNGTAKWLEKMVDPTTLTFKESDEIKLVSEDEIPEYQKAVDQYLFSGPSALVHHPVVNDYYKVLSVAMKYGSGTGSIGLDRIYMLIKANGNTPKILEMKQVVDSVLEKYIGIHYTDNEEAARVVGADRAAFPFGNVFFGSTEFRGRPYVINEKNKFKARVDLLAIKENKFDDFAFLAGRAQAFFHGKISCGSEACEPNESSSLDKELCHVISQVFHDEKDLAEHIVEFAEDEADRHEKLHGLLVKEFKTNSKLRKNPVLLLSNDKAEKKECERRKREEEKEKERRRK